MKIIEVPVYNSDGSVKTVFEINPEEAKHLLEFAINYMASVGNLAMLEKAQEAMKQDVKFND